MIILIDQPLTNDHQDQGPTGSRYPTRLELFFKYPTRPDLANSKPACLAPAGGVEACDTAKSKAHPGLLTQGYLAASQCLR